MAPQTNQTVPTIEEIVTKFIKDQCFKASGKWWIDDQCVDEPDGLRETLTQTLKDYGDAVRVEEKKSILKEYQQTTGIQSDPFIESLKGNNEAR